MNAKNLKTLQGNSSSFGIYKQVGYNLVKATGSLDPDDCHRILAEIETTGVQNPHHFIIDFGAMDQAGANWVEIISRLHKILGAQAEGQMLRVINVKPELLANLRAAGMKDEIQVCAGLSDAYAELGLLRKGAPDVNIVVPFINSLADAVEKIIQVSTNKLPLVLQTADAPLSGDVSGVVSLTGFTFNGTVIVSFPKETILKMVSKLTGDHHELLDTLVTSAVGEFANLAVMSAKKQLNEIGYGLRCGIPRLTTDKELPAQEIRGRRKSIIVPLETELGRYFVDIRY